MELSEALARKKKDILSLWIERTLDSYVSPGFFKQAKDPFANPVGSNISAGLTALLEMLLAGAGPEEMVRSLDQVVRIRAVQEFTPGQAVAPFLELKWIIRQVLAKDKTRPEQPEALDNLDCAIDRMALGAFNLYAECREQLYRNRILELKSGNALLTDSGCPSALMRQEQSTRKGE